MDDVAVRQVNRSEWLALLFGRRCNHFAAGGEIEIMNFKIAENPYRLLAILRWAMVLIFLAFGIQKFTPQAAQGIVQFISHSPLVGWLAIFGVRGEAYLIGTIELGTALLLAAGAFSARMSALGSLMGVATFVVTSSFFFTTPGVVKWSFSANPVAWNLAGGFLFKDLVLLCVCLVLFLASLSQVVAARGGARRMHADNAA